MPDIKPINQRPTAHNPYDKVFRLPAAVLDWSFSEKTTNNNYEISVYFKLNKEQTLLLAKITGLIILKDIEIEAMPAVLQEKLKVDEKMAKQIAAYVALKQFLPIRDYVTETEKLILQWGGTLPASLPPIFKPLPKPTSIINNSPTALPTALPKMTTEVIQKTLRQLAKDNKEALNQNLTASPIKIADFDQPVRPTIKNWLVDYVKIKGAGHHESLERSDYLFNSPNTKNLTAKEKALLAEILKAYDDDLPLPVSSQDQTILLEKLGASETKAMPKTAALNIPPPVLTNTGYREPIEEKDLSGPLKQAPAPATPAPAKPAPRLSGNIIDLKDLQ